MTTFISRRELLRRAGMVGASAVAPSLPASAAAAAPAPAAAAQSDSRVREPLETLTASEAAALEAMTARLIPTDAHGPGAKEARAVHYIDRALGGYLAPFRDAYAAGLAALDLYARQEKGDSFAALAPADQDAVLSALERGVASGFRPSSPEFFSMVRGHTIEGTFCDPYYGGNAGFVGWDLIGYPGVRAMVTADDQKMGRPIVPNHRSAYELGPFNKAQASLNTREHDHGD